MGWNAYAIDVNGNCVATLQDGRSLEQMVDQPEFEIQGVIFFDATIGEIFHNASLQVRQIIGKNPDRFLKYGGLDLPGSIEMLQKATRCAIMEDPVWEIEQVQSLNTLIDWGFPPDLSTFCEYWSSRMFFQVCVEQNLGIRFFAS